MKLFDKIGPENTDETLQIALDKAKAMHTDLVVATSSGATAKQLKSLADQQGFTGKVVTITLAYGSRTPGENVMSEEMRQELIQSGVIVVTAAHVLSGAERGLSKTYGGISPIEVMADTLRMISRGVKVCVEIAVMALDAGAIEYAKPVVCIGGSGKGADSVCVITPSYAASILKTKVNEIVCKPY